jgi:hypothetical protein
MVEVKATVCFDYKPIMNPNAIYVTIPIRYLKSPNFASRPLKSFPQLKPNVQYKITVKP